MPRSGGSAPGLRLPPDDDRVLALLRTPPPSLSQAEVVMVF